MLRYVSKANLPFRGFCFLEPGIGLITLQLFADDFFFIGCNIADFCKSNAYCLILRKNLSKYDYGNYIGKRTADRHRSI